MSDPQDFTADDRPLPSADPAPETPAEAAPMPMAGSGGPVGGPVAGEVLDALHQPLSAPDDPEA